MLIPLVRQNKYTTSTYRFLNLAGVLKRWFCISPITKEKHFLIGKESERKQDDQDSFEVRLNGLWSMKESAEMLDWSSCFLAASTKKRRSEERR